MTSALPDDGTQDSIDGTWALALPLPFNLPLDDRSYSEESPLEIRVRLEDQALRSSLCAYGADGLFGHLHPPFGYAVALY